MAIENKNILSPFKALKNLFKKPITVRFPKEDLNVFPIPGVSPNYRGLHTNDLEKCIGCGTCSDICPTDAIRMVDYDSVPKEGELPRRPVIDYGRCCFCGYCVDVCTTGSLSMSRDYIHIVPTPQVKNPDKEVTLIKNSFIIKPSEEHSENIGYFTPDKYSWLDLERVKMEGLHTEERNDSFIEIVKGFSKEQAEKEASRCVECGVCTETCPAHMNIPEYIHAIWDHDLKESVREIYKTNPLPNVCGRVCTHKCETVCSLSHRGEAVAIRWLKRYAVDNLDYEDVKKVAAHGAIKAKNKKISIIGSGPAGLSAAYYLSLMGYKITIYEKMPLAGGIMRYGIPNYRLPDKALDKDIDAITQLGVKIKTNTEVGKDITIDELKKNSDYVILDTGFDEGRSVLPKDIKSSHIHQAMEYLPLISRNEEIELQEKIVVIGGGNVAFDIARSLSRLQRNKFGKVDITLVCLESRDIMPSDEEEIVEGQEEGIKVFPAFGNADIKLNGDKIESVTFQSCTQVFDEEHRFNPKFDITKTKTFKVNEVIEAVGQAPNYKYLDKYKNEIEFRGPRIVTDENGKTKLDWLYACGDIVKGPDVINGIQTGHNVAKAIDDISN